MLSKLLESPPPSTVTGRPSTIPEGVLAAVPGGATTIMERPTTIPEGVPEAVPGGGAP